MKKTMNKLCFKKTMNKLCFSILSLFLAFLMAGPAFADTVTLFDGSSFQGIILKQDDNTVLLKTSSGEMAFLKGRVRRISFDDKEENSREPARKKNRHQAYTHRAPLLAGCFSCLIPGLGQFYNGDAPASVLCLGSYCLAALIAGAGASVDPSSGSPGYQSSSSGLRLVGSGLGLAVWLYSMFEAYGAAEALNQDADEAVTLSKVLLAEGIK